VALDENRKKRIININISSFPHAKLSAFENNENGSHVLSLTLLKLFLIHIIEKRFPLFCVWKFFK
jgi:hypothetical protein